MVRNSSLEFTLVVFTIGPSQFDGVELLAVDAVGLAFACAALDDAVTVSGRKEGALPEPCWISLPCSLIKAGPSFPRRLRS